MIRPRSTVVGESRMCMCGALVFVCIVFMFCGGYARMTRVGCCALGERYIFLYLKAVFYFCTSGFFHLPLGLEDHAGRSPAAIVLVGIKVNGRYCLESFIDRSTHPSGCDPWQ